MNDLEAKILTQIIEQNDPVYCQSCNLIQLTAPHTTALVRVPQRDKDGDWIDVMSFICVPCANLLVKPTRAAQ